MVRCDSWPAGLQYSGLSLYRMSPDLRSQHSSQQLYHSWHLIITNTDNESTYVISVNHHSPFSSWKCWVALCHHIWNLKSEIQFSILHHWLSRNTGQIIPQYVKVWWWTNYNSRLPKTNVLNSLCLMTWTFQENGKKIVSCCASPHALLPDNDSACLLQT